MLNFFRLLLILSMHVKKLDFIPKRHHIRTLYVSNSFLKKNPQRFFLYCYDRKEPMRIGRIVTFNQILTCCSPHRLVAVPPDKSRDA